MANVRPDVRRTISAPLSMSVVEVFVLWLKNVDPMLIVLPLNLVQQPFQP